MKGLGRVVSNSIPFKEVSNVYTDISLESLTYHTRCATRDEQRINQT